MCAEVGAVEGMVLESATRTLYWTCTAAAVRAAALGGRAAAPGGRAVRTVLRLPPGERPRGLDIDPCERSVRPTHYTLTTLSDCIFTI